VVDLQHLVEEAGRLGFQRSAEEAGLAGFATAAENWTLQYPRCLPEGVLDWILAPCPGRKQPPSSVWTHPGKALWCLLNMSSAASRNACMHSSLSCWVVALLSPGNRTLGISFLRYGTPLLFFLNDSKHFCWNWSATSFSCCCCSGERSSRLTSIMSPMSGILIFGYCPTGRAKKCVDVKSAPHAKHTASRKS
jgi:hypothetical protein